MKATADKNASPRRLSSLLKWAGALVLGLYLGFLPFLVYLFPLHGKRCPCHSPIIMLERLFLKLTERP